MGKPKFTAEQKVEIINAYKEGRIAYSQIKEVYGIHPDSIYRWIYKYDAVGISAFAEKTGNASYTKEFKTKCVKAVLRGEGSVYDVAAKYNISGPNVLRNWILCYTANMELKDYDPKREVYIGSIT